MTATSHTNDDASDTMNDADAIAEEHNLEAERVYATLGTLALDPSQVRHGVVRDEDFQALVDSIESDGLLTDLLVRPAASSDYDVDDDTEYLIIAGSRRYAALQEAGGDRPEMKVPAKVIDVDDETAHRLSLHDNTARSDLTTHELAEAINRQYGYMKERLVPADSQVECPVEECEKTPNGRGGLKRHLSQAHGIKSDTEDYADLMADRYLSVREICEDIASGHPLDWKTINNVVRVSNLPDGAKALIKTTGELSESEARSLNKYGIEHAPGDEFDGDGVSREHIALAQLNEASSIESDDRRSTLLIRAFAEHMDEESDNDLKAIRHALEAWEDEGIDNDEAFERALAGRTPEPEVEDEPEPATAPEDAEAPQEPDEDEDEPEDSEEPEPAPAAAEEPTMDEDESVDDHLDADEVAENLAAEAERLDAELDDETAVEETVSDTSEPEPAPEPASLVVEDAPALRTPIEMTERYAELIDVLPASIEEMANATGHTKQEVYRRMSTLRDELGEDCFVAPSKDTTHYFEGDEDDLDALDEKYQDEVAAMPATTEAIAEAVDYAPKTVSKHIRNIRSELGDDAIRSETDDAFAWNGPTHEGTSVMVSFTADGVSVEPEGILTEAHLRALSDAL